MSLTNIANTEFRTAQAFSFDGKGNVCEVAPIFCQAAQGVENAPAAQVNAAFDFTNGR